MLPLQSSSCRFIPAGETGQSHRLQGSSECPLALLAPCSRILWLPERTSCPSGVALPSELPIAQGCFLSPISQLGGVGTQGWISLERLDQAFPILCLGAG